VSRKKNQEKKRITPAPNKKVWGKGCRGGTNLKSITEKGVDWPTKTNIESEPEDVPGVSDPGYGQDKPPQCILGVEKKKNSLQPTYEPTDVHGGYKQGFKKN